MDSERARDEFLKRNASTSHLSHHVKYARDTYPISPYSSPRYSTKQPLEQKCLVFVKDMDERKVCFGKQREPVVRDISENIHISAEKIVRKRFSKFYSERNGASIP